MRPSCARFVVAQLHGKPPLSGSFLQQGAISETDDLCIEGFLSYQQTQIGSDTGGLSRTQCNARRVQSLYST
jgi:hypothetical protein